MSLMQVEELKSLVGPERDHLQQVEEALHDALLAGQLVAKSSQLDTNRISRATITLLLTLAARYALDNVQSELKKEEFGALAADLLTWAADRMTPAPHFWH